MYVINIRENKTQLLLVFLIVLTYSQRDFTKKKNCLNSSAFSLNGI